MGLGKLVRRAVRVVRHAVRGVRHAVGLGGGGGGGGVTPQPAPAPELELQNAHGEVEEKKETTKKVLKKGKRALKISKNDTPTVSTGRNIV